MKIKWSKILDWSVINVTKPYALQIANGVFGYCVDVRYRHHGLRRVMFPVEHDRLWVSGHELASSRAKSFFNKMYAKTQCDTKVK